MDDDLIGRARSDPQILTPTELKIVMCDHTSSRDSMISFRTLDSPCK